VTTIAAEPAELDPELEELLAPVPVPGIGKIRYTHDAMIDLIIASPGISQNMLASRFGYTASWVSTIMASDAFRERLAERRAEIVDPALVMEVEERFRAVLTRSLEVLQDKLASPSANVPDQLALRAAELGAKALAVGGNAPVQVPTDHLDRLADRLISLQNRVRQGVTYEEGEIQDVEPLQAQG